MQSKMAHAAERKAFSLAIDKVLEAASGKDREQAVSRLIDIADRLMRDTAPAVTKGLKDTLQPGSKWEQYLFNIIDETDRNVLKTAVLNGGYEAAFRGLRTTTENAAKYDCNVPWILLFDPTSACNKHCIGCWAADYGHSDNLSYDDMDSLVTQAEDLGIHMFMMTGGEPLVRKRDILKLAEKHNHSLYNIFTNASLIDDNFCKEVQRLGNIVFSISLEGYQPDTNDARRGDGSFEEASRAMDLLHKYGLLFGTSVAYTSQNTEMVSSPEYLDFVEGKGGRWIWYFQFMPVGKGVTLDLVPSNDQRVLMYKRVAKYRSKDDNHKLFLISFQNDSRYTNGGGHHGQGCVSFGRAYARIAASGACTGCVFLPYSDSNIHDKSLLDCFRSPYFLAARRHFPWSDNDLMPCPMLENPDVLPQIVRESGAKFAGYDVDESPEELRDKVKPYADAWRPVAQRIQAEEIAAGERQMRDVEKMSIKEKAARISENDETSPNVAVEDSVA